jgi:hypothetical protein
VQIPATSADAALEESLAARFVQYIPDRANANQHWVWRGRSLTARCLVQIGATNFLLRIDSGFVAECKKGVPPLTAWDFAIRGSARAWDAFWQPVPAPGWHDLLALFKRGEMKLEGNLHPFLAHLQYIKDLLALPRRPE